LRRNVGALSRDNLPKAIALYVHARIPSSAFIHIGPEAHSLIGSACDDRGCSVYLHPDVILSQAFVDKRLGVRDAEDRVLFGQVVNDRLLMPVDPAGDETQEKGERGGNGSMAQACSRGRPGSRGASLGVVGP
jgi:hypothetical protein